ncbi:MAG: hypothetical protein LUI87_03425 [Lachnospiraceae bacterium]|nr:hypothetical protein [Lachnospiraceae bacterium]
MDELCNTIIRLFRCISPDAIIRDEVQYDSLREQLIEELYFVSEPTSDEADNGRRIQHLRDRVDMELGEEDGRKFQPREKISLNLYELVDLFARLVLVNRHEEAVCRFQYLQVWREVTNKVDSSIFVAAKYANIDYKHGKIRNTYTWKTVTGHNNAQLNKIMDEGISDNHFHLFASTHYFDLSWLTLMNKVNDPAVSRQVQKMESSQRVVHASHKYEPDERKFQMMHLKAALIRVFLFSELTNQMIRLGEYTACWDWLLGYLFEKEQVEAFLLEHENERRYPTEAFKRECRRNCPGFYWLFEDTLRRQGWKWEHFFSGMEFYEKEIDDIVYLQRNHRELKLHRILDYLKEEEYGEMPLEECAWIFRSGDISFYEKEWSRQTYEELEYLLKSPELSDSRNDLQRIINGFLHEGNRENKDYAMNAAGSWYKDQQADAVMIGERWLLYQMFRRRYSGLERLSDRHYSLFYAYLVIKEAFRMELLQSNDREGFLNFRAYNARKTWFTPEYSAEELARIAVEAVFRYQVIRSLEIRIKPGNTCAENAEWIKKYDQSIGFPNIKPIERANNLTNATHSAQFFPPDWAEDASEEGTFHTEQIDETRPYYYVFHFSKRRDDTLEKHDGFGHMFCRHYDLRCEVRRQAEALIQLRKSNPEVAQRVRGIDTCSNEDGCRPEVFATAYRVLRNHSCYQGLSQKPQLPQLRMTYHVGEVFQDIVDGLRAIDEAIRFLNLDYGDRMGHCTVLGMEPREWYRQTGNMVNIRYQDYLDNVVWLYHKLIEYRITGVEPLLEYLRREFQLYFSLIYGKALEMKYIKKIIREACINDERYGEIPKDGTMPFDVNIDTYYYSWMLRGDDPGLYADGYYNRERNIKSLWEDYSINHSYPEEKEIRYILPAVIMNHFYHYNEGVRILGDKTKKIKIPDFMIDAICIVQKELQKDIAHREIGIETNPSSNIMINRVHSYDDHPIIRFFNKGLTNDPEKLEACPQLNVSINTDNQGVFSTELANEYALIVSALGNVRDANGNCIYKKSDIYDWVQNVRKMGNMQSFLKIPTGFGNIW